MESIIVDLLIKAFEEKITLQDVHLCESLQEVVECDLFDLIAGINIDNQSSFRGLLIAEFILNPRNLLVAEVL